MKTITKSVMAKAVVAGLFVIASQPATAINIDFRYDYDTNNFFDTQAKKDVLSAAGSYFGNLLTDNLTAITSSGGNHFNANFFDPANISSNITINDFSVAADTLVVYAGGSNLGGSLGLGGSGGFGASGTSQAFFDSFDRGQDVSSGTDFAPWGGAITFNTTSNWYFDSDVSTDGDVVNNDFYSVALHELGHLLGLGTAGSWDNLVSGTDFTGAASTSVFGGDVPLDPGLGHWADGTLSLVDGVLEETAMDPVITTGTRKVFTELDVAGLKDVGWEVSAVPVPAAVWLFGSGLLGLAAVGRRRA